MALPIFSNTLSMSTFHRAIPQFQHRDRLDRLFAHQDFLRPTGNCQLFGEVHPLLSHPDPHIQPLHSFKGARS